MIKTGAWITPLPPGHIRIGISRSVPKGQPGGFRMMRELAPGRWFNAITIKGYLDSYNREVLSQLDPGAIVEKARRLAGDRTPVLCCFERPESIAAGVSYCHRHMVAQWLNDRLGLDVKELGHDDLDVFAAFRAEGVSPPSYK